MKTKHKKRLSRRRSAAMKNKSTNYNEGELNFSNVIDGLFAQQFLPKQYPTHDTLIH